MLSKYASTIRSVLLCDSVAEWLQSLPGVQKSFVVGGSNPGLCNVFIYKNLVFIQDNSTAACEKKIISLRAKKSQYFTALKLQ